MLQTHTITAEVPEDQAVAAEAAAAAFVRTLQDDVEGSVVLSARVNGKSILPSPQEQLHEAITRLRKLTRQSPKPTQKEYEDAADALEAAGKLVTAVIANAPEADAAPVSASAAEAAATSLPVEQSAPAAPTAAEADTTA